MSSSTIQAEAGEALDAAPRAVTSPRGVASPRAVPAPLRPTNPNLSPDAGSRARTMGRVRELGGRAIDHVAYGLRRLGSATVAGIVALAAAATIFIAYNMPQGAAVSALQAELAHAPTAVVATTPSGSSLSSLPPRSEAPDVVAKIYEEAKAAGVELPRGQYEYVPPRDGVAARYRLTFPVHASYPQIRGFLDRTLIALPAVAVESLRIERKAVGDGSVDAEVKFAAYVRGDL